MGLVRQQRSDRMAQISFGTVLRNEREKKGYDLESVARRLRIRPDILHALETSDFSRMPPRGYARNMVNAYARFLGLNSSEITGMYLEEVYADQVRKARSKAPGTGFNMSQSRGGRKNTALPQQEKETKNEENLNSRGRITLSHHNSSNYDGSSYAYGLENRARSAHPARSNALGTQYTNLYSDSQTQNGILRSKLPLVIAGAIILILLIVILVVLFSPKAESVNDIQKVPVTGVDDTTKNDGSSVVDDTAATPLAPPAHALVEYSVPEGESAYIEVYIDDVIEDAETIVGPSKGSYEVTGNLVFVTTNPSGIKVSQDGTELSLVDSNGVGVYSASVDFPTILEQWNTAHPQPKTSDSAPVINTEPSA